MTLQGKLRQHRHQLVPTAVVLIGLVVAAIYWCDITAWFSGETVATQPGGSATIAQAGPFRLTAALVPDPPREKRNVLRLVITEATAAVDDASVTVTYRMPPMGSMQEMRGEADVAATAHGTYDARFDLPMGGSWSLHVSVEKGQSFGEATFNMTVGTSGLSVTSQAENAPATAPRLPEHQFDTAALEFLRASLAAYEQVRGLLVQDSIDGLSQQAQALRVALEAASQRANGVPGEVVQFLSRATDAARRLGESADAIAARRPFGELSMHLVALVSVDPRLAEGLHIFKCPMAEGFQKWFQRSPHLENPYMGQRMPACGVRSEWSEVAASDESSHSHEGGGEIAHYTCSMHPSVKQLSEGTCPICAMNLTPVTREEVETGTIFVDEIRRQRIGVRVASATRRALALQIRAVGQVRYDETRLSDVNLRIDGWVQQLRVDETGQRVRRGQTLLTLYSPELYAAQLEYLTALRRQGEGSSDTFASLARASRQRLHLLGMPNAQISELEQRNEAWEYVPILAPSSGFVVAKNVVAGARVEAGTLVYRIADLSRVWIDAEVYESDLPHVRTGQQAVVELPHAKRTYKGRVDYIYPTLEGKTRTGRVRVVLDNRDLDLKPEMYANVQLEVDLGERLVVPDSAVIYTGPRRLVFVDLGEGRLRPKVVQLGVHAAGFYEVTEGLHVGDVVVTSGNFLIAAESRIRSAADYWGGPNDSE